MNHSKYITKHYALWLDLRTTDNNSLRGSGGALSNVSEGIKIQITKKKTRNG